MSDARKKPDPKLRSGPQGSPVDSAITPLLGVLRWIRDHVAGFHAAIGAFLLIGLGLTLAAVVLFAGLATLVAEGAIQRFDDAVLLWMNSHANETLDVVALEVTTLGSAMTVWMVVLVGSVFLWASRHRYSAALLWVAALGSGVVNAVLKNAFDRPRPQLFEWRTDYAGLSSFPSGHAMGAMVIYATLAYLVIRLEPSRRLRQVTLAVAVAVVLLVGATRIYLGVHYPTDVIAGYLAGLIWATVCALGIEAVRYFRYRKPDVTEDEADLSAGMEPLGGSPGG